MALDEIMLALVLFLFSFSSFFRQYGKFPFNFTFSFYAISGFLLQFGF